jgi:parallel beta-helix repeat protein
MPTGDSTLDTANLQAAMHDSRLDSGGTLYLGPGTFKIHGFVGRQNLSDSTHPSFSDILFNGTIQGAGKGVTVLKGVRGPGGVGFEPLHYEIPGFASEDHTLLGFVQSYLGVKELTFESEPGLVDPFNAYGSRGLVNYLGAGSFVPGLNELIGTDIANVHFKGSFDSLGNPETPHHFQLWGDEGGVHNVTNSEFENSSIGALQFFELLNAGINVDGQTFINHPGDALDVWCHDCTVAISNNEIRNSEIGIYLYYSENSQIEQNKISGWGIAPIVFQNSGNTIVSANQISGDWAYGITPLFGSDNCTIANNTLIEMTSYFGVISVDLSDRCTVRGNSFVDVSSPHGAIWISGKGNTIRDNDFTQSGLPGWSYDNGAVLLDYQSIGNHVREALFPPQTTLCDQVRDLSGSGMNAQGRNSIVGNGICNIDPKTVE